MLQDGVLAGSSQSVLSQRRTQGFPSPKNWGGEGEGGTQSLPHPKKIWGAPCVRPPTLHQLVKTRQDAIYKKNQIEICNQKNYLL